MAGLAIAKVLQTSAAAGAVFILAVATASAQAVSVGDGGNIGFSPFKQTDKPRPTQDQIEKQQKLDDAYKAATNKIPDQKSGDPWAVVRPSGSAPAPTAKKKTPTQ
jgi:hypothetical protein